MPTLPVTVEYSQEGYGYEIAPAVVRTEFASRNTRQRRLMNKRDDIFTVNFRLTNSELQDWEEFVRDEIAGGGDTFTAPYYTSDVEYTGTFYLVDGLYDVSYVSIGFWNVACKLELKGRALTEEQNIYELIEDIGTFDDAYALFDALEDMINNNNL